MQASKAQLRWQECNRYRQYGKPPRPNRWLRGFQARTRSRRATISSLDLHPHPSSHPPPKPVDPPHPRKPKPTPVTNSPTRRYRSPGFHSVSSETTIPTPSAASQNGIPMTSKSRILATRISSSLPGESQTPNPAFLAHLEPKRPVSATTAPACGRQLTRNRPARLPIPR